MLLIAASHLRFLQPLKQSHCNQELEHFSRIIPSFSAKLSEPMTTYNVHILGACSLLILQYSWASLDTIGQGVNDRSNWVFGDLPGLYSGMRQLGLLALSVCDPYLTAVVTYRPIHRIMKYLEGSNLPLELEAFFTHCCQCPSWSRTDSGTFVHCMDAAQSLIPLISTLKIDRCSLETSGLIPDILRCLFIWPSMRPDEFRRLIEKEDEVSLVIVLYYYAAVLGLASGKFWWMRERAACTSRLILSRLGTRCQECTGWAAEICTKNYSK